MNRRSVSHQTVRLVRGRHPGPEDGVCAVELASMLSGEPFSDHPVNVCPVIAAFVRAYNDSVNSRRRQDLRPAAARIVDTRAGAPVEQERLFRCIDAAQTCVACRPRWRHPVGIALESGAAADVVAWRVARILRADGDRGHARALALIDELVAIGAPPAALDERSFRVQRAPGRSRVRSR